MSHGSPQSVTSIAADMLSELRPSSPPILLRTMSILAYTELVCPEVFNYSTFIFLKAYLLSRWTWKFSLAAASQRYSLIGSVEPVISGNHRIFAPTDLMASFFASVSLSI
jgi:hypothetical protein